MDNPAVSLQRIAEHVALVTLTRPEARNAVNGDVARGLEQAVDETEADPDTWVVILAGSGDGAFCAGADLKAISGGRIHELHTERGGFAGGCEIALKCDLIVAAPQARFGVPEVKRGLIAAAGGLYRLPRALPPAVAREMILTGDPIDASRAHALGMVNVLAPEGTPVLDAALALATRITCNAPVAVRESLAVANRAFDLSDAELMAASAQGHRRNMASEDFREGPLAFIEKRAPRWKGR